MKTRYQFALIAVSFAFVVGCAELATSNSGWTNLFDGTSTDKFRGYNMDSFPEKAWLVENGTLHAVPGKGADLITKERFKDFELELDWKVAPGGNSGVIYRASETKGPSWHTGPEMQILDDTKGGGKLSVHSSGSLYDLIIPSDKGKSKPVGEWNHARLVLHNNHGEHWLNGVKVIDYTWGSPEIQELITKSKFAKLPGFMKGEEGFIAFQHHGQEFWMRNIRIRRL